MAKVKISGFKELSAALQELGKSTGRNVLRRVARDGLEPMAEVARAKMAERTGEMKRSTHVGTRLARSQRVGAARAMGGGKFKSDPSQTVRMHMGPGQQPQAITEEFGTFNVKANPSMRPAFDGEAEATINRIADGLWPEIEKAAKRKAKKAAKSAAKG